VKVRIGFVSNSSSESFLLYGIQVEKADITEEIEQKIRNADLIIEYAPDLDEQRYVGRSWDAILDDETGREFRETIRRNLIEIFGTDVVCNTHSQAWYNG